MSQKPIETKNQSPKPSLTPSAEHKRLEVFVGKWKHEGQSYGEGQSKENPYDSAVKWTSEETYEWLSGGFFLVHRFDALLGGKEFKGIEIIGYDASSQSYFVQFFDNSGNRPTYLASVSEDTWTFTGEAQRATVLFSDDNNTMTIHWDWKTDGENWLPLCDRKATKFK